MKNIIYILFLTFLSQLTLNAQDVHYSQFENAPMLFNPSLTGVIEGQKRVALFYRNQWHSALKSTSFKTYSILYEQKFNLGRNDFLGLGGFIQRDKAGEIELGKIDLQLSGAYIRKIGGGFNDGHYLSAGFGLGVSHLKVNAQKINWADEYNAGTNDFSGAGQGEVLVTNNKLSPNISTGITWWSILNKKTNFYFAIGLDHLNRPNTSLLENSVNPIPMKLSINGGSEFPINKRISLLPSFIFLKQATFKELNVGTSFKYILERSTKLEQSIQFGVWSRFSNHFNQVAHLDAIILKIRVELLNGFQVGISYDINTSGLTLDGKQRSALEIAMSYTIAGSKPRRVFCPTF